MSVSAWSDAVAAAMIFAVDPVGTGVMVRARMGPVRERWFEILRQALPPQAPLKQLPSYIADARLLGGLDLDATLRTGKPVAARGLLAEANDGILIVGMAERLPSAISAHLASAMDGGAIRIERDGISKVATTRFGVVAIDEGIDDETAPAALRDRLAMTLDLDALAYSDTENLAVDAAEIKEVRASLARVSWTEAQIGALCNVAGALGIASLRAPLQAIRVARAAAALKGRGEVDQDDIALAARLVLAPRATVLPSAQEDAKSEPPEQAEHGEGEHDQSKPDIDRALDEVILAAAQAALPTDLLASLRSGTDRSRGRSAGKSGAMRKSKTRGRPTGTRHGDLRSGGKLNIIETLRAAAPWQRLRRRLESDTASARIIVQPDDFRITRFRQRSETATIFVVDASGSAALHRLAEAKGAVELLLADCYVRRDEVALIAFRGTLAEILLPPTRSLTRAKRSLSGLPGGGGTPLATGLDAAMLLADAIHRKGQTPSIIMLTDGRANIARDGLPGRAKAEDDAISAAKALRAAGIASVLIDTSARPSPVGEKLAKEMGARYLPLPYADAAALSKAVKAVVR